MEPHAGVHAYCKVHGVPCSTLAGGGRSFAEEIHVRSAFRVQATFVHTVP